MEGLLNQIAPDFTLSDQNGENHTLSDYRGKWVLLYFYPKDNTPGCTKEACKLQERFPHFENLNVQIVGVSVDSIDSHKKFAAQYHLEFPLLSDSRKDVVRRYNVWGEKKFMGRVYQGIKRTSFLINPEGKIIKIYEKVNPLVHADTVLRDLKDLQEST